MRKQKLSLKVTILAISLILLNACVPASGINGSQTISTVTETVKLLTATPTITPSKTNTPIVIATQTQISTNPAPEIPIPLPYDGDYIVFIQNKSNKRELWFYDLDKDQKVSILPDWDINYFININSYDQLAFSSSHEGNSEIYILNYPFDKNDPINISLDPLSEDSLGSWSPDGQHLLFRSNNISGEYLKIWDGTTFTTIGPFQEHASQRTWGPSGKLAYALFTNASSADPSEVYVWDGENLLNISQNPNGVDRDPVWSEDGQLAFLSERNGEYDVYIWDGVSNIAGKPDVSSFLNIAPELTMALSYPAWTSSGHLSFRGYDDAGQGEQIFEWDGETVSNISQIPITYKHGQTWREDGYWAFSSTFHFFGPGDIIIRNSQNETVMTTPGFGGPVWSHSGKLIFCNRIDEGFSLSIWDGTKVLEIVQGGVIFATSRNGDRLACSVG